MFLKWTFVSCWDELTYAHKDSPMKSVDFKNSTVNKINEIQNYFIYMVV